MKNDSAPDSVKKARRRRCCSRVRVSPSHLARSTREEKNVCFFLHVLACFLACGRGAGQRGTALICVLKGRPSPLICGVCSGGGKARGGERRERGEQRKRRHPRSIERKTCSYVPSSSAAVVRRRCVLRGGGEREEEGREERERERVSARAGVAGLGRPRTPALSLSLSLPCPSPSVSLSPSPNTTARRGLSGAVVLWQGEREDRERVGGRRKGGARR
jgi:hypothetical protein